MALDDPTIARVSKNGYRILAPLAPGMRSKLDRPGVLKIEDPTPWDPPASVRAPRATAESGFGA